MKGVTSAAEWVVAGVSALLILAAVGYLFYEALTSPPTPPVIELRVDSILDTEYGYIVEFHARNHGHSTAAQLAVEGVLLDAGRTIQMSRVTIDYVPSESRRSAGIIFTEDPARYTLELRALGYDRP